MLNKTSTYFTHVCVFITFVWTIINSVTYINITETLPIITLVSITWTILETKIKLYKIK